MNKTVFHKVGTVALVAIMAVPFAANAESTTVTGPVGTPLSTTARVDFQITIPKFLSLRVGSAAGAISLVTFAPSAAQVDAGGAVTGAGGDLGGGAVTAIVRGNSGPVTLGAATIPLTSGTNSISWTQITTATSVSALTPPVLIDGASTATTVAAVGGVVNQSAVWTYSYANSVLAPAGVYGGTATNGRVTYTASVL